MKILTVTALLLSIALPAAAQVGPAYVSQSSSYGTVCTAQRGSSLSLRSGPGKNYRALTHIRDRSGMAINNSQYGQDGFKWLLTSFNGRRGWVRSDYVCGTNSGD